MENKQVPNGFKYNVLLINKPKRVKVYLKGTNQYTILYR